MQNIAILTDKHGKELVSHGDAWFPLAGYDELFSKFVREEVPWHWHDEIELVVVWEGSTLVELMGTEIPLETGDAILINCNQLHRLTKTSQEDCRIINFVFNPEIIGGKHDSKLYREYVHPLCTNKNVMFYKFSPDVIWERHAIHCIEEAFKHHESKNFTSELLIRSNLTNFWAILCKNKPEFLKKYERYNRDEKRIKEIIEYIHAHYNEKLSIDDLAALVGICRTECYRLFQRMLKCTPSDYILSHRLQIASKQLLYTDNTILDISMNVGISTPAYFTKRFKEQYNCTPFQFRKKNQYNLNIFL